jgi:catabolite regulation protein CreA
MPVLVKIGSVKPPNTTVVKTTIDNVVDMYISRLAEGMLSDNANDIAPRNPANQITSCIRSGTFTFLTKLARKESGNVFKNRAAMQIRMHKKKKRKLNFSKYLAVNRPMPMYKKTKNSDKDAKDLKTL